MAEDIEQELGAIKTIVEALQPLNDEAQRRALAYATQRLGIKAPAPPDSSTPPNRSDANTGEQSDAPPPLDIRSLTDQKQPGTDIEMATLVAYYLKHKAPDGERKDEIGTEDIDTYFVQAGYPLPSNKTSTLPNAKKAGYLESASWGKYKLNSVGHNLVAHNLPRSGSEVAPKLRKKTGKKNASKKTAQKKTANKKSKL